MKITFIYAYEGENWSTPLSIVNEFKTRGWDTEIISIGSNRTGYYHDNDLKKWVESKPITDIVLFMDWGRFDSPYLDKDLVQAFWVQESGDDPQNFERNYPKSIRFNLTLTPDYESYLKYTERGINAEWWTHFADTQIHYPLDINEEYVAVSSRGMGSSEILDTLTNHYEGQILNKNGWDGIEHTKFLNSGKIIIQHSRWGEITRRIFEGMACGKLVITDKLSKEKLLEDLFTDGEDIILYEDLLDCANKISYYNEHDEERKRIALNGYNKVLNFHTQIQRTDLIIEKWKNSQSA
jgi:hypothetical protein